MYVVLMYIKKGFWEWGHNPHHSMAHFLINFHILPPIKIPDNESDMGHTHTSSWNTKSSRVFLHYSLL